MKKLSLVLIGLMACLAIGVSTSRGQVGYSVTDLGVVKDMVASEPAAINNQGFVAGTSYAGEATCAFLFKKLMEDAGGVNSRGFGINSTNMVVGDAFFGPAMEPRSHAAIFSGGVAKDLGVLEGQVYSRANGINAMGQVVGFSGPSRDSNFGRAFIWTRQGGMLDIGTLGGPYAQAYAINDAGFVTGTSYTFALEGDSHAFIYQPLSPRAGPIPQPMRDLGALGGFASFSCGMAVNSSNHVAGYSRINVFDDRVHAFFHNGSKMLDLGSLGGSTFYTDSSVALGLNNWDQVVGYSYVPLGNVGIKQVAFLWSQNSKGVGEMKNLNELIGGAAKSYSLFSATAINDNGQIAASAYYNGDVHAVLLTPMPAPMKWPPPAP